MSVVTDQPLTALQGALEEVGAKHYLARAVYAVHAYVCLIGISLRPAIIPADGRVLVVSRRPEKMRELIARKIP